MGRQKWKTYLERLASNPGAAGGIFGVHNPHDSVCPFQDAERIYDVLNRRQEELGLPLVVFQEMRWDSHIKKGKKTTPQDCHHYREQTFLRPELISQLLPCDPNWG